MLENIEPILRDQCKLDKDRPIIVGVSGGPDSLCLMEILRAAGYPIIVAHFNHQLRPEADAEAGVLAQTAAQTGLDFVKETADVRAHAQAGRLSLEEAARDLRYRFLFDLARKRSAQAVAVGHTADDQVETVLMHFLRGSGLAGLKGMTYRTVLSQFDVELPVVRPLLHAWRAETIAFCEARGLHPQYDASNDSLDFLRNRIRHQLIPSLETYNPKFRAAVWRMAQTLKDDDSLLKETLEKTWRECVVEQGVDAIIFDAARMARVPSGLRRNLIRHALQVLCPAQETAYDTLERASAFIADSQGSSRVDLIGGLYLFRESESLYLCTPNADLPLDRWPQMPENMLSLLVTLPGQTELSSNWKLTSERLQFSAAAHEHANRNDDQFQAWLDADVVPDPLELRRRRSGDRFEPLGMHGHSQKLSDFMVNEKIPVRARQRWPLLCAGETVIWVPGYRLAHPFRLTSSSRSVWHFSLSQQLKIKVAK